MPDKNHCNIVKVYTTNKYNPNDTNDEKWKLIAQNTKCKKAKKNKFYLKSNHEQFIKIVCCERQGVCAGINYLKWNGFEPRTKDEITQQIKVYQSSPIFEKYYAKHVLQNDGNSWQVETANNPFIVFDCNKFEIDRIAIQFPFRKKCGMVKLRMSDIQNAYNFHTVKPVKFKINCAKYYDIAYWLNVSWTETISFSDANIYKNGFKRYIQLQFDEYPTDRFEILQIKFYGHLSENIPIDCEQFDPVLDVEYKQDDETKEIEYYKPQFVDSTPSPNSPILNLWLSDRKKFWRPQRPQKKAPYHIIIDLGNNDVDYIYIRSHKGSSHKLTKVKTGHNVKGVGKDWKLLHEDDNTMEQIENGVKYDIVCKHNKYILLSFENYKKMEGFALNRVMVCGDSKYLEKEEKELTEYDLLTTHIDEDLIAKYGQQQRDKIDDEIEKIFNKIRDIKNNNDSKTDDINGGKYSNIWYDMMKQKYSLILKHRYLSTMIDSKQQVTIYEEEQLMKIYNIQKKLAENYIYKLIEAEINKEKELNAAENERVEADREFNKAKQDKSSDKKIVNKLKQTVQMKKKHYVSIKNKHVAISEKLNDEISKGIKALFVDTTKEKVYQEWKESVEKHPRILSSVYNVTDYERMIIYAEQNHKNEMKKLWGILADLLDQSLVQKSELLHKFHLFQLSALHYYDSARGRSLIVDNEVCLLFDCKHNKLSSIQFRIQNSAWCNKIEIYTADILKFVNNSDDEKKEISTNMDDECEINYDNFNLAAQINFNSINNKTKNKKGIQLDQSMVDIKSKHDRFIRIKFLEFKKTSCKIQIQRIKFILEDGNEAKQDEIEVLEKYCPKSEAKKYVNIRQIYTNDGKAYSNQIYFYKPKQKMDDRMRDEICKGVNLLRKSQGGKISKHDKHFVKFLLCWQNSGHYDEILKSSKRVMNILRRSLVIAYKKLQNKNSEILRLKLNEKDKVAATVISNHELLKWDYNKWYTYRKALFWPVDLKPLTEEWKKLGLHLRDEEFKQIRRDAQYDKGKSLTSSDELAMEYLNLICYKLDPSFQNAMKELFKTNRNSLELKYPSGNHDIGVLSGPVKTKARQSIKVRLDYFNREHPQCMSVLDIVRCAIVCETDEELCSLFYLLCKKYSGKILRVKNAFDNVNK
eukprot:451386_1